MSDSVAINLVKNELGNTEEKSSPSKPINLRKYTYFMEHLTQTYVVDVKIQPNKLFQNVFVNNLRNYISLYIINSFYETFF